MFILKIEYGNGEKGVITDLPSRQEAMWRMYAEGDHVVDYKIIDAKDKDIKIKRKFKEGDRVRILNSGNPKIKVKKLGPGTVIFNMDKNEVCVEYQYQFLTHVDIFKEEDLESA